MQAEDNSVLQDASLKLRPVTTLRASEVIYNQIKDLILSGELKQGERLPSERSLMESLQRSRPTIREALRMLEHAGFIRTVPGTNGAIVQSPDANEVEQSLMVLLQTSKVTVTELTEYRLSNDTAVARWAARRRTEDDIELLTKLLDEAEQYMHDGRFEDFIHHDAAFHGKLAQAGKNTVSAILAQILSRLTEPKMLDAVRRQSETENAKMCARILANHQEILEAVKAGDPYLAEQAMAKHVQLFSTDLRESEA